MPKPPPDRLVLEFGSVPPEDDPSMEKASAADEAPEGLELGSA